MVQNKAALRKTFDRAGTRPAPFAAGEGYRCYRRSDHVLQAVQYYGDKMQLISHSYLFDFLNRIVHTAHSGGSITKMPLTPTGAVPFSQFDRACLEWHYECLVKSGGKPRPLDAVTPQRKYKP